MKILDTLVTINSGLVIGSAFIVFASAPSFFTGEPPIQTPATAVVAGAYTQSPPKPSPTPTTTPSPNPTPTPRIVDAPSHITIPNLGIDTSVVPVGITPENVMEVPSSGSLVGWYTGSPKPGEEQPRASILTGHFDTTQGLPAVFHTLETIEFGDAVLLKDARGTAYEFSVTDIVSHQLEAFPTEIVYGETNGTYIKLITCDGVWNPDAQSYNQRLVVTARLVKITEVSPM